MPAHLRLYGPLHFLEKDIDDFIAKIEAAVRQVGERDERLVDGRDVALDLAVAIAHVELPRERVHLHITSGAAAVARAAAALFSDPALVNDEARVVHRARAAHRLPDLRVRVRARIRIRVRVRARVKVWVRVRVKVNKVKIRVRVKVRIN